MAVNRAEQAFAGKCPGCESQDVRYGRVEVDDVAFQLAACTHCNAHWSECYTKDSIYITDGGSTGRLMIDTEYSLPTTRGDDVATEYTIYEATTVDADSLAFLGTVEAASAATAVRKFFTTEERGPRSVPEHVAAIPSANVHTFTPTVETQTRLVLGDE